MAENNAQFAIDIAATMGGGEQTAAELDVLTAKLMGGGKGADFFQQAIKKLSTDLSAAKAATEAANAALATGQQHYAQLETAALQAAKAAEKAARGKDADAIAETAAKALEAKAAVNAYVDTLSKLEAEAKDAAAGEDKLSQSLTNVKKLSGHVDKSLAQQAEQLSKLGGSLGAVGGPLGSIGQQLTAPVKGFAELSGVIGKANAAALLGVVGFAALAAAVVAVGVAAVVATAKVASWAVGLADSARSADLAREAIDTMNPDIAALRSNITGLEKETGLADSVLVGLAKQLKAAKVSAADMPGALRAAALAEKALGAGGAADFVAQIQEGKKAVSDLANETSQKLGGVVARQMLSLEAQSARLENRINDLFGGLNIEPVLNGMQVLVDLFDEGTESGEAIKFLFESIFQPIIDQAENAAYVVEAFFLGLLIGATKAYIAIKPAFNAVAELFGFEDTSLTDVLNAAKTAGEIFAYVVLALAATWAAALVVVTAVVAVIGALIVAMMALPGIMMSVGESILTWIVGAFNQVVEFLTGIDFAAIGANMIQGLINGIMGMGGQLVGSLSGLVKNAIASAKSVLGIASPSKVFEDLGSFTGEGFAIGVEAENDNAHAALAGMADPSAALANTASPLAAVSSPADSPAPAAPLSGGGPSILQGANLHFYGVKDAEHAAEMLEDAVTRVIEGDAMSLGATTPAEAEAAA